MQAIKKALSENFHGKEESDPQVILYKNLWLEAEASLCSASCMARFHHMKSEMDKLNSQKVSGKPLYEISGCNVCSIKTLCLP